MTDAVADAADYLAEGFKELIWPTRCVGCDLPGTLLCEECEAALPRIDPDQACPHCGAAHGVILCTECDPAKPNGGFPFQGARAFGRFEGALASMLVLYKDEGEKRLAPIIARLLAITAGSDWRSWADCIVFVPASADAFRRRGFDHMEQVARAMAAQTHIALLDVLARDKVVDQRKLDRQDRAANAAGSFQLLPARALALQDRNVLLIDDVFTTGATLSAAAQALIDAGARAVRVVVAARVW